MLQPITEQEATFMEKEQSPKNNNKLLKVLSNSAFESLSCKINVTFVLFVVFSVLVPAIVLLYVTDNIGKTIHLETACAVHEDYKVPCGSLQNATEKQCEKIHCCFDKIKKECFHSFPSRYFYKKNPSRGYSRALDIDGVEILDISCKENSDKHLSIRVTEDLQDSDCQNAKFEHFQIKLVKGRLALDIYRSGNTLDEDNKLVSTKIGPLISANGYWEWNFQLTDRAKGGQFFGLGQLLISENVTKYIYNNKEDHNTLPLFVAYRGGKYHAVLLKFEGIAEMIILKSGLISLRAISGSFLGFDLFPGPSFVDVVNQISNRDAFKKSFPRWILGTHICRNSDFVPIGDLEVIIKEIRNEDRSIFENYADCIHENLFLMLPTIKPNNPELKKIVSDIKSKGKFVFPLGPHISTSADDLYNLGKSLDVFFKNSDNEIYIGLYKNHKVAFIDFTSPKIITFMDQLLSYINNYIELNLIDGFFLIDNWPQDDSYKVEDINTTDFTYINDEILQKITYTLPWDLVDSNGSLSNLQHNNYGSQQINILNTILKGKDVNVPLWSSSVVSNEYPALVQNNQFSWTKLKQTILLNLYNNFMGNPMISNIICPTNPNMENIDEELCIRWMMAAAVWPGNRLTRNIHSDAKLSETAKQSFMKSLKLRKMLSYYLYGELKHTGFALKPMFMDFRTDNKTWNLVEQNMIGNNLLAAYITLPQATKLSMYLPEGNTWYEFWSGQHYQNGVQILDVSNDERVLFIMSGTIIPLRVDDSFHLVIACSCSEEAEELAAGRIVFDENDLVIQFRNSSFLEFENLDGVQKELESECQKYIENTKHPLAISILKIFQCNQVSKTYRINYSFCKGNLESKVEVNDDLLID